MTYYYAGLEYSSNDLVHHGIKGQRWGIRRFQNEDGSLTKEGKERYGNDVTKVPGKVLRKQYGYMLKTSNKNYKQIEKEREEELKNDPVVKEMAKYAQKNEKRNPFERMTKEEKQYASDLSKRFLKEMFLMEEKYSDRFTDARLKDMGYNPTEQGREYLRRKLGYYFAT